MYCIYFSLNPTRGSRPSNSCTHTSDFPAPNRNATNATDKSTYKRSVSCLKCPAFDIDYYHYLEMNSVGDFLGVAELAWTVYNGYKDAPGDFKDLSDEIKSLHNIVNSNILTAKFRDPNLTSEDRERLQETLQECENVLKDLDNLFTKYKRLESPQGSSLRALDRAGWDQEDIVTLRARLTSNTTFLNTFIARYLQLPVLLGFSHRVPRSETGCTLTNITNLLTPFHGNLQLFPWGVHERNGRNSNDA